MVCTYLRLKQEFAYLAVVLDPYWRRAIGLDIRKEDALDRRGFNICRQASRFRPALKY